MFTERSKVFATKNTTESHVHAGNSERRENAIGIMMSGKHQ